MRWLLNGTVVLACALSAVAARPAELWRDDFASSKAYERWGPRCWTPSDGAMHFSAGQTARLIVSTDDLQTATSRARLTATKRLGGSYVLAGLTLFVDEGNYWQLLLVESPDGKRYFEVIEDLQGNHQAQSNGEIAGSRLAVEETGELKTWEYGVTYDLELKLTPEAISGTVTDPQAGRFWRRTYSLQGGRAVKRGRAGLVATGLAGSFRTFTVEGSPPAEETRWDLPSGPAGTVAVLADEPGTLAKQWAQLLRQEGYGVLVVSWDDLLRGPLPISRIDLLVLADARRVPVPARDAVKRALRASRKVIAVGAPAFMEVLAHTPQGWVGPERYADAWVGQTKPVPLPVAADSWRRGAQHPERPSTIQPVPEEGKDTWKLSFDYDGWDGFQTSIPGVFAEGRSLLTFWARGDAETSQMLVECAEKDGSRWIATVPLTTEWRAHGLRPQDFPYWYDSPAKRGQPGDHFRPENVASLTLGLAQSHTTKVQPGRRTLWVKQLATAADPGDEEVDFSIPEVQTISPSYMLFPLRTPVILRAGKEQAVLGADTKLSFSGEAYSPIWRERGRGWDRGRAWRWVPLLEARDENERHRGALLSLTIGDAVSPNALWANASVADPAAALANADLRRAVVATAKAMTRGCFLVSGGAPYFSGQPGEEMTFGAEALNAGRQAQELRIDFAIEPAGQAPGTRDQWRTAPQTVAPGARTAVSQRQPVPREPGTYRVTVTLSRGGEVCDRIAQELVIERQKPTKPDDFVRVEGSQFVLHGKPWYFKGINYWPTWVGGYSNLGLSSRECYDPEIIERDLSWLQSVGINAISAVQALQPPDPEAPGAFRDQLDFLDRCERHGIKVFFFVPNARPFAGADAAWVKQYLDRAGIKNHPAVMTWELAWEPIHGAWGSPSGLAFMQEPWNAWVVQRYGSVQNALTDWGYRPTLTADGKLPVPTQEMATKHGAWDPMVSAFRRAWGDIFSQGYREIVSDLRAYDPQHLISFRFGACSVPSGQAFAHAHSVGVLKHVDFMNPEGYSLMKAWGKPTPPDDLRQGGLITLYFRHFSGEKPVVWMEFGYTVSGINEPWQQARVRIKAEELANQQAEYEGLYSMFIESGARGASPWWLPGGFRRGENSDFGVVEPDGSERPACEVIRKYLPRFDQVRHDPPTATLDVDFDAHAADGWEVYSKQYLSLVQAGKTVALRTAGTGTDSATCPLAAVGGRPYSGHNPLLYLSAEFNSLEVRSGAGPWRAVKEGEAVDVTAGQPVYCRASIGNLAEAAWRAPKGDEPGGVYLAGRKEYGLEFAAPIATDTRFLGDATVKEFVLVPQAHGEVTVSFEMTAKGRAYFGERRTVKLRAR